jgi:hypothetical protein
MWAQASAVASNNVPMRKMLILWPLTSSVRPTAEACERSHCARRNSGGSCGDQGRHQPGGRLALACKQERGARKHVGWPRCAFVFAGARTHLPPVTIQRDKLSEYEVRHVMYIAYVDHGVLRCVLDIRSA